MFETLADDLLMPEGPVWLSDGSVLVVEIGRACVTRVLPDGRKETVARLGGGPNGSAIGPDGALYICNSGGGYAFEMIGGRLSYKAAPERYEGGAIQRLDLTTGRFDTIHQTCEGRRLLAPNDLVFDRSGGFWFTDHGLGDADGRRFGGLYYAKPDGSTIRCVRRGLLSPNGVGLSPDERWLYWADTITGRLWRAAVSGPGDLAEPDQDPPGQVVRTLPGYQRLDSLAVEACGNVCVATIINGGVTVFDPEGDIEHVAVDDPLVTNLCFGGPDMRDVWITASGTGRLLRGRWPRPGLQLAFNA